MSQRPLLGLLIAFLACSTGCTARYLMREDHVRAVSEMQPPARRHMAAPAYRLREGRIVKGGESVYVDVSTIELDDSNSPSETPGYRDVNAWRTSKLVWVGLGIMGLGAVTAGAGPFVYCASIDCRSGEGGIAAAIVPLMIGGGLAGAGGVLTLIGLKRMHAQEVDHDDPDFKFLGSPLPRRRLSRALPGTDWTERAR